MKQHARRYVAETKTDILTASDLKSASVSATEIQPGWHKHQDSRNKSNSPYLLQRGWDVLLEVGKGEWLERETTGSVNISQLKILEPFSRESLHAGMMRAIPNCSS